MRQLPAFWTRQQEGVWEPATRQLIQAQEPDVGIMDDLEVRPVNITLSQTLHPLSPVKTLLTQILQ